MNPPRTNAIRVASTLCLLTLDAGAQTTWYVNVAPPTAGLLHT